MLSIIPAIQATGVNRGLSSLYITTKCTTAAHTQHYKHYKHYKHCRHWFQVVPNSAGRWLSNNRATA
jgi:hypothetical protein